MFAAHTQHNFRQEKNAKKGEKSSPNRAFSNRLSETERRRNFLESSNVDFELS